MPDQSRSAKDAENRHGVHISLFSLAAVSAIVASSSRVFDWVSQTDCLMFGRAINLVAE